MLPNDTHFSNDEQWDIFVAGLPNFQAAQALLNEESWQQIGKEKRTQVVSRCISLLGKKRVFPPFL